MTDSQVTIEAVKASPVVTYSGAVLAGIPIADWVTILTVVYLVLQLLLLIPKYLEWYHGWRLKCKSKPDSSKSD